MHTLCIVVVFIYHLIKEKHRYETGVSDAINQVSFIILIQI